MAAFHPSDWPLDLAETSIFIDGSSALHDDFIHFADVGDRRAGVMRVHLLTGSPGQLPCYTFLMD